MDLKNKVVVITGGSKGIGKAVAEALAREGGKIFICARSESELRNAKSGITKEGGWCEYSVVDVTKEKEVERFIDGIISSQKRIDVIVNNAGWCHKENSIEDLTDADYRSTFSANVDSVFYFLRKVVPLMKKQKNGIIINISSMAGKHGHGGLSAYSASKFAVLGFTESVARELAGSDISCISICPSGVNTSMRAEIFGEEDAKKRQPPEAVASAVREILIGNIKVPNGASVDIRHGKISSVTDHLSL